MTNRLDGHAVAKSDEIILEVDLRAIVEGNHGGHRLFGHRQDGCLETPGVGYLGRDFSKSSSCGQTSRAVEVRA